MGGDATTTVLAVLAVDPVALGGLWLRSRAGPARLRLIEALRRLSLPLPLLRLPPNAGDEALFGGLDIASTLGSGSPVSRPGLLDRPAVMILPMAERCDAALAARLAQALDRHHHAVIALDEAADESEGLPLALADRLALFLCPDGPDEAPILPDPELIAAARRRLPMVKVPHTAVRDLVAACDALGIDSLRAPTLALTTARILAALAGRDVVEPPDLAQAAEFALAHRAASVPPAPDAEPPPLQPPPEPGSDSTQREGQDSAAADILVAAARAALPEEVLRQLDAGRLSRSGRGATGSGAARAGNRRGRPLSPRRARPSMQARLDLVATLRSAAPWQAVRRSAWPNRANQALLVAPTDFHIRRCKDHSDRLLIFAVDASGSAAVARLAEAKGAVEMLLAQAYSRRDHVALLTFRGTGADLLLPPSRSLVQARQRLRGLPGGGGTPLASGLELALDTATRARGRGMTPTIAVLTDGKCNVALDGRPNRELADAQSLQMALAIRKAGTSALVIDVGQRPNPRLAQIAMGMGARYIALPRATAGRLAGVLESALER
ncbi:magnesium chelatase subunit D [Neotabrizicola shimadae]|uniref:Magnesium chelatase subunit D n=1 Tax=Neotabrizicola shimadae TaxID=2807096 RepID=A0A8G0ZVA6_9RHOB|nr:magnesium chelatase subunit D [Neotabrizicola shimadae]QYZ69300.1 magnesium chelatase subunit D [Neotabrizicola shimadae]